MFLNRVFHRSTVPIAAIALCVAVLLTFGTRSALAVGTTRYVNPDSICGGSSPCYGFINSAINAANSGDKIIIQVNLSQSLTADHGLSDIEITAPSPLITLSAIQLSTANHWNIHDFTVTNNVLISGTPNGMTIANLHVHMIALRQVSGPIGGTINITGNTLPGGTTAIEVSGADGQPINGIINIKNNVGVGAINVLAYVSAGGTGNFNAALTIDNNATVTGTNLGVYYRGSNTGVGNITGNITISNNTTSAADAKLAIALGSAVTPGYNVTGIITGNITFTGNRAAQLAIWSAYAPSAPMSGNFTVTNNNVERIEFSLGGAFSGSLNYTGNYIHYQGSAEGTFVSVYPTSIAAAATVNIANNTGNTGFIVRTATGNLDGALTIQNNVGSHLTLQLHGTNTKPYSIIGNTFIANDPTNGQTDGNLMITSDTTSLGAGTISSNNVLSLNVIVGTGGGLAGNLTVTSNIFASIAGFFVQGPTGVGTLTLTGNTLTTKAVFQNMKSEVHFNRILGIVDVNGPTTVNAQDNWWGCNGGPGSSCHPYVNGGILQPHLVLAAVTVCTNSSLLTGYFNVLNDSSGIITSGNVTPGLVTLTSVGGTPVKPSVGLSNGAGTTGITLGASNPTSVTYTLDQQSITTSTACGAPIKKTIGVYHNGVFLLRNTNTSGGADLTITFGPTTNTYPIVGDWTGSGIDTIGVYDQAHRNFILRDSNTPGAADHIITLGNPGDLPMAGRWMVGATHDGIGVFRPTNGLIYLRNTLTTGFADHTMVLGSPGDQGLAGDWTNKGFDSPGVYRPSQGIFYMSNKVCNCTTFADFFFTYGAPNQSPLVGDWTGSGTIGVGTFNNGVFSLRNTLTSGSPDLTIAFGAAGDIPLAGRWVSPGPSLGGLIVVPDNGSQPPVTATVAPPLVAPPSFDG